MKAKFVAGIIVYDGVEALDFAGPFEVMSVVRHDDAPLITDPCAVRILLVAETAAPVTAMGGMKVIPDSDFAACPPLDVLIVPGGPGERREHDNPAVLDFIRARSRETKITASVCTGAFFLGKAGLLEGRRATTHSLSIGRMREMFPGAEVVEDARYVDEGDIITSAGISAGIDMTLHILKRLLGEEAARAAARVMEYDYR
jgi:transcriptional regulator GlxA family with amidase domain